MESCQNVVAKILNVLFTYARPEDSFQVELHQAANTGATRRHILTEWEAGSE